VRWYSSPVVPLSPLLLDGKMNRIKIKDSLIVCGKTVQIPDAIHVFIISTAILILIAIHLVITILIINPLASPLYSGEVSPLNNVCKPYKYYIMKTIADFKRSLTVGSKLHSIFHQASLGRDAQGQIILGDEDKGIREVSIVQSNSFALKTVNREGKTVDSWMSYPKKDECKFLDENTIQILTPDFRIRDKEVLIPCITYKFV
jgi:hypothetical protein